MATKTVRMRRKSMWKGLVAITLALSIMVGTPLKAFAAGEKEYISELKWAYINDIDKLSDAKTADEKWLTDNGYKMVDGVSMGSSFRNKLHLGYKTTTNPNEAITDIAVMNMNGGYSFSEYENLLNEQKKSTDKIVSSLLLGVKEYRDNYAAGSPAAKYARDMMNQFKEDDSDKLMGDFLLDPASDEKELSTVFLQANGAYFTVIKQNLALACTPYGKDAKGNEKTVWMDRLSKLSGMGVYEAKNEDKYNTRAAYIQNLIIFIAPEWQQYLKVQKIIDEKVGTGTFTADQEKQVQAIVEENYPPENILSFSKSAASYTIMNSFAYEDYDYPDIKTLADLILKSEELQSFDFHAMVSVLTEAEYQMMTLLGISSLITTVDNTEENWQQLRQDVKNTNLETPEITSIYEGVDRELFRGKVALTSESIRANNMNVDTTALFGNIDKSAEIALLTMMGTSLAVMFGATIYARINGLAFSAKLTPAGAQAMKASFEGGKVTAMGTTSAETTYAARMCYPERYSRYFSTLGKVFYAAMAVLSVLLAAYIAWEMCSFFDNDYTTMPLIMMDTLTGEDGKPIYVKYDAVTQQKLNSMDNYIADLNTFKGNQWIVMYTSKDKAAGAPITADLLFSRSSTQKAPYTPIHRFGEKVAYDLQKHTATFIYKYGYFVRDEDAFKTAGSVFTFNFTTALALVVGAVVGGAASACSAVAIMKKKKKKPNGAVIG